MSAIGKAIGPLVNIALLLLFAIIIFAIIGLEFYAGALNKTCYDLSDLSKFLNFPPSSIAQWNVSQHSTVHILCQNFLQKFLNSSSSGHGERGRQSLP